MTRSYRMTRRAETKEGTRDRIVRATMSLHDEKGVATTSYADIAERAGVGAATVYRHFPTIGSLVEACGAHVWQQIAPPRPEDAARVFAGLRSRRARLERLVRELDGFYARGAVQLWGAEQDRDRIPELDAFLKAVGLGVTALVTAALEDGVSEHALRAAVALCDFTIWRALSRAGLAEDGLISLKVAVLEAAIAETSRR